MFGLSAGHLLILAVVLLIFGARRLPELGGALGRGLRAFKSGLDGREEENKPPPQVEDDSDKKEKS